MAKGTKIRNWNHYLTSGKWFRHDNATGAILFILIFNFDKKSWISPQKGGKFMKEAAKYSSVLNVWSIVLHFLFSN